MSQRVDDSRDFEINGIRFQVSKLNAFKQFHIVRKLAPVLAELLPVASKFSQMKEKDLEKDHFEALAPLLNGIAGLPDKDADFILYGLLAAVDRKQESGNWAKMVSDSGVLLFHDLELPTLIQLAGRSFMYNLSGFFAALPAGLNKAT